MSAMIASDKHINTLVSYALDNEIQVYNDGWHSVENNTYNLYVRMLSVANHNAYDQAYKHLGIKPTIHVRPSKLDTSKITPVEILKAVDFLEYQCDGAKSWDESVPAKFLLQIKAHAIRHLPGYDDAEWGID